MKSEILSFVEKGFCHPYYTMKLLNLPKFASL